jgi:AcrR family transcriptional regulator
VPKVPPEHLERRREQILSGARRCFARHGYEGATVVRLEREIGLSRGAIFHYFGNKENLFLALVERDSERIFRAWAEQGFASAVRTVTEDDPAWLGVYTELTRRLRTDSKFRARYVGRQEGPFDSLLQAIQRDQKAGRIRDDVPARDIAKLQELVLDGLWTLTAISAAPPRLDRILSLVDDALAPSRASSTSPGAAGRQPASP